MLFTQTKITAKATNTKILVGWHIVFIVYLNEQSYIHAWLLAFHFRRKYFPPDFRNFIIRQKPHIENKKITSRDGKEQNAAHINAFCADRKHAWWILYHSLWIYVRVLFIKSIPILDCECHKPSLMVLSFFLEYHKLWLESILESLQSLGSLDWSPYKYQSLPHGCCQLIIPSFSDSDNLGNPVS